VTENHDTFDSIVSRGIGNLSLENTQTNEGEDDLRDDISDLNTDETLRNTAAESSSTHTEVGSNGSNYRQSPGQERPHSYNTIDQRDNRPDEEYDDDEASSTHRFTILWNGIWKILY